MAIKIDNIPGVNGSITIEGAAEERTMRDILEVLQQQAKAEGIKVKETNEALKELGENAKDASDGLKNVAKSSEQLSKQATAFGKSLANTASNIALNFAKAYDDLAEQPVKAGAMLINAATEIQFELYKVLGAGAGGLIGSIGKMSRFGPLATQAGDALAKFSADAVEAAKQFYLVGNQIMSAEFEKRIKSLEDFTKAGASFGGSLDEIAQLANDSGIGILNFTKAVTNSREAITDMGLTGGEAAKILSKGLMGLAKTTGTGGKIIRDELRALGYSYEEQGEIMALFMTQQRRAGVNLENLAPADLARGTEQYAKNLKLLSDLTGQDAKKLLERAQAEAMRGMLLGKLQGDQRKAFEDTYAALTRFGPEVQAAFVQMKAQGFTSIGVVAAQSELTDMLKGLVAGVNQGRKDMTVATTDAMAEVRQKMATSGAKFSEVTDAALINNVTGMGADIAKLRNNILGFLIDPGEAAKSQTAIENQSKATGKVTDAFVSLTNTMTTFQNKMETFATENLPAYATVMANKTKEMADVMSDAIDLINDKMSLSQFIGKRLEGGQGRESLTPAQQQQFDKYKEQDTAQVPLLGKVGPGNVAIAKRVRREQWLKEHGYTIDSAGNIIKKETNEFYVSPDGVPGLPEEFKKGLTGYDKGGKIESGEMGVVGERGPELVTGPGSVLSRATTAQLMEALDAMRELKGIRFGENDFDWQVGMQADRRSLIQERAKAFKGFNYTQLQEELARRPEMDDMRRARESMMAGEDQPSSTNSKELTNAMQEQNSLLRKVIDTLTNGNRINDRILQQGY